MQYILTYICKEIQIAMIAVKGCTHRAMILCDGAVDSNNLKPSHSGNTYPLRFLLFSI